MEKIRRSYTSTVELQKIREFISHGDFDRVADGIQETMNVAGENRSYGSMLMWESMEMFARASLFFLLYCSPSSHCGFPKSTLGLAIRVGISLSVGLHNGPALCSRIKCSFI
ncbi:unnamed protein product [Cyberlindnera jadinii]|uniref:Uncharacterized protein n=1 Tax=Cyberlindnera jadinii (strain ATCC 18201 / CBS 1600 / BCRC 20928 / JCM 3617 / NBRC 0987 / NRRL Y-1542) TaxID=983966 RepID=A0A0H5C4H0_CYBJN|nr:unnamed protein product [Cyberlindnera jadinii]